MEPKSGHGKEVIIPYHPSQIKIEKHSGKKTASMFCSTRKPADTRTKRALGVESKNGSGKFADHVRLGSVPGSDCTMSSINTDESDFSDNVSVVSDVSDLSVMSFPGSFTHSMASNGPSGALAGVHGRPPVMRQGRGPELNDRRIKQLAKKMALLQTEKDAFQRQANQTSSHRLEVTQLKEESFQLRRENVNLKSQLESMQTFKKTFPTDLHMNGSKPNLSGESSASTEAKMYEFRCQLRTAQDEIFRLQADDDKSKLERKTKALEIDGLRQRLSKLSEESSSLKRENRGLRDEFSGLEASRSSLDHVNKTAENNLTLLDSDLKRAIEAKDWYQKQMQIAQEQRIEAQQQIVKTQEEVSGQNVQIVELKSQLDTLLNKYDNEQMKNQNLKDDFSLKLKKIESEMLEQENSLDKLITEKDEVIAQLTDKLNDREDYNNISGTIQNLEMEMCELKQIVSTRDSEIVWLQQTKGDLERDVQQVRENFRTIQTQHEELEGQLQLEVVKGQERDDIVQELENGKDKLSKIEAINGELESTLQGALNELEFKANSEGQMTSRVQEMERKLEDLEHELLEKHQSLDDSQAEVERLRKLTTDQETVVDRVVCEGKLLLDDRNQMAKQNVELHSELESTRNVNTSLTQECSSLREQLTEYHSHSPAPDLVQLKEENQELRLRVLYLEQFENESMELQQEVEDLKQAKDELNDKLLESEKAYFDKIEKLGDLVDQREALIDGMKTDIEAVEMDLCSTRMMLESNSVDSERMTTEQSKRLEELEDALEDYDAIKREFSEMQQSYRDLREKYSVSVDENENLVTQFQNVLMRIEDLEMDNLRLKNSLEDCLTGEDEVRELHAQRITRLETFIKEYEKEIEDLNSSKVLLQNQIITLEDQNGKLQSESIVNESLREQILQLQRDLKNDTDLRQDLVKSIEMAKHNLEEEISSLESSLRIEKQNHAKAREAAIRLEHENLDLQQELNSLHLKQDECLQELSFLQAKSTQGPNSSLATTSVSTTSLDQKADRNLNLELALKEREIKELEHLLEEKARSVVSLEDHISTLKFHLQQKSSEVEDAKKVMALNLEKYEEHTGQLKAFQESLKQEKASSLMTIESVSEERNNYRSQVQDMNLALKNSLEHIRQLRSQASQSPSSSLLDEAAIVELLQYRSTPPIAPSASRNLSNLHHCLASLKAEMAILQSKLAPVSGSGSLRGSPDRGRLPGLERASHSEPTDRFN